MNILWAGKEERGRFESRCGQNLEGVLVAGEGVRALSKHC